MNDERFTYEFTLTGKNARNQTGEAHIEYKTHAPDPLTAAKEMATELGKALGKDTVTPAGPDKGDG
jgi:hypothetical protein